MTLRLIVIGLVVANVFLWGWSALQPEPVETPAVTISVEPEEPLDVPSITLAREAAVPAPGGDLGGRQCYTLGPLRSRSALETIQETLDPLVVQIDWHESTAVVEQGFWVYLEPFGSYSQAAEAVAQLVEHGIRDYYIMPEGQYGNAVSVGLYEQRSQAQTRIRQIEALGLGWPVVMEMQRRDEPRFWIDFELRPEAEVAWEELVAGEDGARQLEVPCPENEASFPPT